MLPARHTTDSIAFIHEGRTFMVDLGAPMAEWHAGRKMVRLADLWVAAMLPGDIFDVTFTLVTSDDGAEGRRVDGLSFARGFVAIGTHELFWPGEENAEVVGLCAQAIVVRRCDARAANEQTVRPGIAKPAVDLRKLLPILSTPYPSVSWMFLATDPPRPFAEARAPFARSA
jgi:hypothetical protein